MNTKHLLVLTVGLLFSLVITGGCSRKGIESDSLSDSGNDSNGVEVSIEGGGEFPAFLVGKWKVVGKSGWEFVFDKNGQIVSVVHTLGRVVLEPGETTKVPMRMEGESIYEPGEWIVDYSADDRELTVEISLKSVYAEIGDDVLEGSSRDIFSGPVSEDKTSWSPVWISFYDYTAHTEERPNFKMASDPTYGETRELVFEKVEE